MTKVLRSVRNDDKFHFTFYCPGCKCYHGFNTTTWKFNNDMEKPTVSPSLLTHYNMGGVDVRCHLFIREGKLQYLNDCTHELKGQTIEMREEE